MSKRAQTLPNGWLGRLRGVAVLVLYTTNLTADSHLNLRSLEWMIVHP